jgi:hypothetical protein
LVPLAIVGAFFYYIGALLKGINLFEKQDFGLYPFYAGTAILVIMILAALIAIILMVTKSKCFATCYCLCLILPFILFALIGAGIIVGKNKLPTVLVD